jgi:hypothetical protein
MTDNEKKRDVEVIVFRFSGGALDGEAVRSDQSDATKRAESFWKITWNGTVGRRFDVMAPTGPSFQRYQVKSKYQTGIEIHVTCEFVE